MDKYNILQTFYCPFVHIYGLRLLKQLIMQVHDKNKSFIGIFLPKKMSFIPPQIRIFLIKHRYCVILVPFSDHIIAFYSNLLFLFQIYHFVCEWWMLKFQNTLLWERESDYIVITPSEKKNSTRWSGIKTEASFTGKIWK